MKLAILMDRKSNSAFRFSPCVQIQSEPGKGLYSPKTKLPQPSSKVGKYVKPGFTGLAVSYSQSQFMNHAEGGIPPVSKWPTENKEMWHLVSYTQLEEAATEPGQKLVTTHTFRMPTKQEAKTSVLVPAGTEVTLSDYTLPDTCDEDDVIDKRHAVAYYIWAKRQEAA